MPDKENVDRITPQEAYAAVEAGNALIVCAYDKKKRCKGQQIQGSLTKQALEAKFPEISKDQQIIFYCT